MDYFSCSYVFMVSQLRRDLDSFWSNYIGVPGYNFTGSSITLPVYIGFSMDSFFRSFVFMVSQSRRDLDSCWSNFLGVPGSNCIGSSSTLPVYSGFFCRYGFPITKELGFHCVQLYWGSRIQFTGSSSTLPVYSRFSMDSFFRSFFFMVSQLRRDMDSCWSHFLGVPRSNFIGSSSTLPVYSGFFWSNCILGIGVPGFCIQSNSTLPGY